MVPMKENKEEDSLHNASRVPSLIPTKPGNSLGDLGPAPFSQPNGPYRIGQHKLEK